MVGVDAQILGARILSVGFSFAKCNDAVAIAADSSHAAGVKFNASLSAGSDGSIPALTDLRALGLGGNHTNLFLRRLIISAT